jgi:predicted Zn-ribbon and HTH transcriptional regulator
MNCPQCRSRDIADRSYSPTPTSRWRMRQCRDCGWEDHQPETRNPTEKK